MNFTDVWKIVLHFLEEIKEQLIALMEVWPAKLGLAADALFALSDDADNDGVPDIAEQKARSCH